MIESNGGTRRIEVRIERPGEQVMIPETAGGAGVSELPLWGRRIGRRIARLGPGVRIAAACAGAIALRLLVALTNALPIGGAVATLATPRLSSVAIVLAIGGVLGGLRLAARSRRPPRLPGGRIRGSRARALDRRLLVRGRPERRTDARLVVDFDLGARILMGGARRSASH